MSEGTCWRFGDAYPKLTYCGRLRVMSEGASAASERWGKRVVTFDEYLADLPLLHTWDNGHTWNSGGFEPSQLRGLHDFLADALPRAPFVLETGAGNTTITLSFLAPANHVVICPDDGVLQLTLPPTCPRS